MKFLLILILLFSPILESQLCEAWSLVWKAQEMGIDVTEIRSQLQEIQNQLEIYG